MFPINAAEENFDIVAGVDIIAVMDFGRNQRQVAILRGQFRVLSIYGDASVQDMQNFEPVGMVEIAAPDRVEHHPPDDFHPRKA